MQARSRWLLFFLVVIALLVVAIWPRSTSTEAHSSARPQVHPAASQAEEEAADSGFHRRLRQRRFCRGRWRSPATTCYLARKFFGYRSFGESGCGGSTGPSSPFDRGAAPGRYGSRR